MAIDIWIASVGVILIYIKKKYKSIKPLFIYKNKNTKNIHIPNMNMFTNSFDDNSNNYNLFIKTRSKSLPIIYEDRSF